MAPKMPQLVGQKFGRWTTIRASEERVYKHHFAYECRCDCGTERLVSASVLKSGASLSCGCLGREISSAVHLKHGLWKHRLHSTWRAMKERCSNSNATPYPRYGGRGIYVC